MSVKYFVAAGFCVLLAACEGNIPKIPAYTFAHVSAFERDTLKTNISYNEHGVSVFHLYENDAPISTMSVSYKASSIVCSSTDGNEYRIIWDNTIGGMRAREVIAEKNGLLYYQIEYFYDAEGRLIKASLDGIESQRVYVEYEYTESSVKINDAGNRYEIPLSGEANTGYVCNVMAFTDAYFTNEFIINPDLYFLNIYGTPVMNLPAGVNFTRSGEQLTQVGKYHYEY